jgi:secreted trypsin-like serine protease
MTQIICRAILVISTFPLILPAFAGTTDDAIPDWIYVERGKKFSDFVRMVVITEGDGRVFAGSCVLISQKIAITSAHIVDKAIAGSVDNNRIERFICHPEYDPSKPFHADIAILYCENDFGISYYPPWSAKHQNVGTLCTVAGYGDTGKISTGAVQHGGTLRAGTQTIERFEAGLIIFKVNRGSSPLEYGITSGDSGGPVYVGAGADARLVAINSLRLGGSKQGIEGEETAHTELAAFAEWIDDVVKSLE